MEIPYRMATDKTARKVTAGSWAGAVTSVIIYFLKIYVIRDTPLPEPIELALGLAVSGVVTWGATWIAGRMTRPSPNDNIVPDKAALAKSSQRVGAIPDDTAH